MNIRIICVGKIKEAYFSGAIKEYSKRLGRYTKLEIIEVPDEKTPEGASEHEENLIKEIEGRKLLAKIKDSDYVITLAIKGKKHTSESFSKSLSQLMNTGKSTIDFVIGGSLGTSDEILKRSDATISFSDMTFPHQLMRVILLEQIYRAFRIMKNEPYHK